MAALFALDDMTRFECCEPQMVREPILNWIPYHDVRNAHIHATVSKQASFHDRTFYEPNEEDVCCDPKWDKELCPSLHDLEPSDIKVTHLRLVNAAMQYLTERGRRQISARDADPTSDSAFHPQPVFFGKAHVTPHRSDMWIDGFHNRSLFSKDHDDALFAKDLALSRRRLRSLKLVAIVVLCSCYGAAHLSAWNFDFPTPAEMWLWRASAICMASTPGLFLGCWVIGWARANPTGARRWEPVSLVGKICAGLVDGLMMIGMPLLGNAILVGYIVGRPYVLLEGFISLRDPPPGTYQTVSWTGYIPHMG
ncbi:hypothetical protein MBLNU459_g0423t1 [Dothideomycetes sp. NU459]